MMSFECLNDLLKSAGAFCTGLGAMFGGVAALKTAFTKKTCGEQLITNQWAVQKLFLNSKSLFWFFRTSERCLRTMLQFPFFFQAFRSEQLISNQLALVPISVSNQSVRKSFATLSEWRDA